LLYFFKGLLTDGDVMVYFF